jgi:uncharacterized protein (DUF427 family)
MSEQLLPGHKTIKVPGPDHPITIEHNTNRVVVTVASRVVADTRDGLILREASYPAVHYVPREDVDMALLERTEHATPAVMLIKDHLAFCPDRVDAIEERHGDSDPST